MVGSKSYPSNTVFLWHWEMWGGVLRGASRLHHQHSRSKDRLPGGRGKAVKLLFRVFLQNNKIFWFGMLLSRERCAGTSLSPLLSCSTFSLLTQALRNPLGKAATRKERFHTWLLHISPAVPDKPPPTEESFSQQPCQDAGSPAAEQWVTCLYR